MNERTIKLSTWLDDGVLVLEHATLIEELGRPFEFRLDLLSQKKDIAVVDAVWSSMTIAIELPSGQTRYFNGIVTRFTAGDPHGDYARYHATLRPWLWLLTRVSDCRIFQNMTVPDVIQQVWGDLNFGGEGQVNAKQLSGSYRTWDYLVQYRESSFNFVSRLMEQEGIYYYFEHSADQHTLVLADSQSQHKEVPGYKIIPYLPEEAATAALQSGVEHIGRWEVGREVQPMAFALDDFNFQTPRATMLSALPATPDDDQGGSAFELYDYPGVFKDGSNEGDNAVRLFMEQRRALAERAQGSGSVFGLATGHVFTLADYPVDSQNKKYLVLSTNWSLTLSPYGSGAGASRGPEAHCRFTAMDGRRQFRTARQTPKPLVYGPQTAIVVGQSGQEITTDEYGRVKVQFHWDRVGGDNEKSSCWVRVAQLWAGSGWGSIHLPRIGQEVMVEFLEGDPDRPIITGRVYNADNMPPYKLPDNKTQSGFKSRSTPGGSPSNFNEIRFEDKKGSEEFHVQAEKDHSTLVKNNQSISVGANRNLSVGGNEEIDVTGTRTTNITKKETQNFKNDREMNVTLTNTETITQKHTGNYNGGREENVSQGDTLTVNSSNKKTTVHGQYDITADDEFLVTQKANSLLVKDAVLVSSVGEIRLDNQKSTVDLKDGVLTISSANQIVLKCGSAQVSLKSDGTIEITGSQKVTANGGGAGVELAAAGAKVSGAKATVSGTSMTEVTGPMVKIN